MTSFEEEIGARIRSAVASLPITEADQARLTELGSHRQTTRHRFRLGVVVALSSLVLVATGVVASQASSHERRGVGALGAAAAFPVLSEGESCPTSTGHPIHNAYFGGVALGYGPVRMLVANRGQRGIVKTCGRGPRLPSVQLDR